MLDPMVWLIIVPLAWASLAFILGPGRGARLAIAALGVQFMLALYLARLVLNGENAPHAIGGWGAPLGIDLAADGLAAIMLLLVQFVAWVLAVYARGYLKAAAAGRYYWPITGFLLAGMNALFMAEDLFNIYVTLELVGLAAVGLVAVGGGREQLAAALRYLFATLVGSGAYLLGVALIYGTYGTVSIAHLTPLIEHDAPTAVILAGAAMLVGLMIKTALVPFHTWLPPAHGGAPGPVSALLSALVVKASFYLILRLWLGPFAPLVQQASWLMALLGCAAVVWGSIQAIRTKRLKLLVAYSTVAQLGYLFLIFPLLGSDGVALQSGTMQLVAHGLAKAAMFAAAGALIMATGKDSVDAVAGVAQRVPLTLFAFALAGVTLMGLPPSAGFLAKWLLIDAALARGHVGLAGVAIGGGLLAAVYVFRIVRQAFLTVPSDVETRPVPRSLEWSALVLAGASVLLGLRGIELLALLGMGQTQ